MGDLNIVMYHYVREIEGSDFPRIRGLEVSAFSRQLDYLAEKFSFVTERDVMRALAGEGNLPDDACWLTFDDGYKDHYTYVLPELLSRGISGSFFVPSKAVLEEEVLDVHAIQHVLASIKDEQELLEEFSSLCRASGVSRDFTEEMWVAHAKPNRFDTAGVIYFKRMLQHLLPQPLRSEITTRLLETVVGLSKDEFSSQLYLSLSETQQLVSEGMSVGGHTHSHPWLSTLSPEEKLLELEQSRSFLEMVGMDGNMWSMAYPYGAYDMDTVTLARSLGCAVAVTTEPKVARTEDNPLLLARLDTNDFRQ